MGAGSPCKKNFENERAAEAAAMAELGRRWAEPAKDLSVGVAKATWLGKKSMGKGGDFFRILPPKGGGDSKKILPGHLLFVSCSGGIEDTRGKKVVKSLKTLMNTGFFEVS